MTLTNPRQSEQDQIENCLRIMSRREKTKEQVLREEKKAKEEKEEKVLSGESEFERAIRKNKECQELREKTGKHSIRCMVKPPGWANKGIKLVISCLFFGVIYLIVGLSRWIRARCCNKNNSRSSQVVIRQYQQAAASNVAC